MPEDLGSIISGKGTRFLKRSLARRAGVIACLALVVAGGIYYVYSLSYESTDDAFIESHIIPISAKVPGQVLKVYVTDNQEVKQGQVLAQIDPRDYESALDRSKATLQADIQTHKGARINVELTKVTSSSDVQLAAAGVELAKAGVITAKAQMAGAKSKKKQAEAQLRSALAAAEEAKAQIPATESEVTRTENDLKRYQGVYASGVVTPQQMDSARSAARTAQSNFQSAQKRQTAAEAQAAEARAGIQTADENIRQAESQVVQAEAQVAQAVARLNSANAAPQKIAYSESQVDILGAQISQAQAATRQAELNLSYTKILAPEDGRITRKSVESGAYIQAGQPLLALVSKKVWVLANFKETQLSHMRPGQPVRIRVDAYSGKTFTGHVDSIQAGSGSRFSLLPPENATGNYVKVVQRVPVKIVFDEQPTANYFLGPGMSVVPEVKVR
jgi:membrane fusion protein, multidrug efflux system